MNPEQATEKNLRSFGIIWGAILGIVTGIGIFKDWGIVPWITGGVAGLGLFLGGFHPSALQGLYQRWMRGAGILGRFNTRVLLTLVYLIVFPPIRLLLVLLGKDPLKLKWDPRRTTYWEDHPPPDAGADRYKQQY